MRAHPKEIHLEKRYIWLVLVLFLCMRVVLQALIYRAGFKSITADEFGRIVLASQWAENPHPIWGGGWLPFGEYLFGIALKLKWELLWIPRLITILFGLASIIFMYLFSLSIFNDHRVAIASTVWMGLNPIHVQLSSVPLTEMLYGALVVGMAWYFSRYLSSQKVTHLISAAILMAIANGFRFEAWLFSIVLIIFLFWEFFPILKSDVNLSMGLTLTGSASLIIAFPVAWMIASYYQSGNFFSSLDFVRVYKATWQAAGTDFLAYARTILSSDPFLAILAPFGIGYLTIKKEKSKDKIWYIALATIPFILFISLHRGQIEPHGIMFRYMGLFTFFLYPAAAFLSIKLIHRFSDSEILIKWMIIGLVLVIGVFQVNNNFRLIINDLSATGLNVGQKIRYLRESNPTISQRPVMVELSYWEYLAIQVGANDINEVIYDRPIDLQNHQNESWISTDFEAFLGCLATNNVSYVIVKSPSLKQIIEQRFEYPSSTSVNDYAFFPVLESTIEDYRGPGVCPPK